MTGMPEAPSLDPQAMRQAVDMMSSMRPEALQQMASMAASQQMPSMSSSQDAGVQQQQQQSSSSQVQAADPMQALQAMQVLPLNNSNLLCVSITISYITCLRHCS